MNFNSVLKKNWVLNKCNNHEVIQISEKFSLKEINVRLSIDWFEGHSLDKLWNLGMKNFFPKVKRI